MREFLLAITSDIKVNGHTMKFIVSRIIFYNVNLLSAQAPGATDGGDYSCRKLQRGSQPRQILETAHGEGPEKKRSAEPGTAYEAPAKGHRRTAQGRRPLRGVVHVLPLLDTRAFRLRLAVSRRAANDSRESTSFFTQPVRGRVVKASSSPVDRSTRPTTLPASQSNRTRSPTGNPG